MDRHDDITDTNDSRALAALISGYTGDAIITDAEVAAVIEWCREWARDCEWIEDAEDVAEMSDAVVLRSCHRHIDGGLAFVLADVRRCAEPAGYDHTSEINAPTFTYSLGNDVIGVGTTTVYGYSRSDDDTYDPWEEDCEAAHDGSAPWGDRPCPYCGGSRVVMFAYVVDALPQVACVPPSVRGEINAARNAADAATSPQEGSGRTRPVGLDDSIADRIGIDARADDARAAEILSGAIVKWALVFEEDCATHPYTLVRLVVADGTMRPTMAVQLTPSDPLGILADAARTNGASLDDITL